MAKKSNKSEIAVLSNFTMERIPEALAQINEKIKQIQGDDKEDYKITVELEGFGNIQNITEPDTLIKAYGAVTAREQVYKSAAEEMGVEKVPTFKISGHSAESWKKDIIRRYRQATQKEALNKLKRVKDELEKHLSDEDKLKALFTNVADIMTN